MRLKHITFTGIDDHTDFKNPTMKPHLLFSKPYYNQDKNADPHSGKTYRLCQNVKKNAYKIDIENFREYARHLPEKCILIPVPSHSGKATYNRELCNRLRFAAGYSKDVSIVDALICEPHPSLCETKRKGKTTENIEISMSINRNEISHYDLSALSEKFDILLVDNVLDTGKTIRAAADAIGIDCKVITLGYTGNDHGIFNPYKMLNSFIAMLDKEYSLDSDDGLTPQDFEQCLSQKSLQPLYEKEYFSHGVDELTAAIEDNIINESKFDLEDIDAFIDRNDIRDELHSAIMTRIVPPEREALLNSQVNGRIEIISNYDCWVPPCDTKCLSSKDTLLWGLMAELCLNPKKVKEEILKTWDVYIQGPWPDIKSRNGKEIVSYKEFVNVLFECPNYGIWTFFGVFDMQALLDHKFDTETMVIPKGTTCTMYNNWNGGGSCTFAKTLREVSIKEISRSTSHYKDGIRVIVDEKGCGVGYSSPEVYGSRLSDNKILL